MPLTKRLFDVADAAGIDLRTALSGDDAGLRPTEVAQPALFLVEVVLNSMLPHGIELLGVAGHSVGEYAALVAAGVIDAETGMKLVVERGRAMAAMREGTMAAILGLDPSAVDAICQSINTGPDKIVVVANFNAPGQTVISGTATGVAAAGELARERGARRFVPLNVSGAFHSPLMAGAAREFTRIIESVPLRNAAIPVVSNVDAQAVRCAVDIRHRLCRQLVAPVRWSGCVAQLAGLGVDALVEVGPGTVLSGLAKRIAPGLDTINVATPQAALELVREWGGRAR